MRTKITIVFTILFSLHSFGQNFIFGGINYKISSATTVEVSTNAGIVGTVNLPSNINYENVNYLVTGIGEEAFLDCTGLTSITIPNSVTSIASYAFSGCTSLTSVTIPNSVISIGPSAFESCYSLTSVTIPNSIVSIGNSTFGLCTGLKSIMIPNSVTSIGDYAFALCNNLTSVTVDWTTPLFVNSKVFEYLPLSTITLNIPEGTETAYKAANVWKEFKIATLSTNSFSTNNSIHFYPNPVQSQINFSQEINSLEVFDRTGRKVKSFQNPSRSFDVSNLANGAYIIKCKTDEGKTSSQKMLKQ
jgi:BspA type Leucine rich repeat region (6 copies)/Secretion system C-terminal sorting domain